MRHLTGNIILYSTTLFVLYEQWLVYIIQVVHHLCLLSTCVLLYYNMIVDMLVHQLLYRLFVNINILFYRVMLDHAQADKLCTNLTRSASTTDTADMLAVAIQNTNTGNAMVHQPT